MAMIGLSEGDAQTLDKQVTDGNALIPIDSSAMDRHYAVRTACREKEDLFHNCSMSIGDSTTGYADGPCECSFTATKVLMAPAFPGMWLLEKISGSKFEGLGAIPFMVASGFAGYIALWWAYNKMTGGK